LIDVGFVWDCLQGVVFGWFWDELFLLWGVLHGKKERISKSKKDGESYVSI